MAINQELLMQLYEDEELLNLLKTRPKEFMAANGMDYDEAAEYRVLEDSAEVRHIVIPHLVNVEVRSAEVLEERISKLL